jgi:hypothetical protein
MVMSVMMCDIVTTYFCQRRSPLNPDDANNVDIRSVSSNDMNDEDYREDLNPS